MRSTIINYLFDFVTFWFGGKKLKIRNFLLLMKHHFTFPLKFMWWLNQYSTLFTLFTESEDFDAQLLTLLSSASLFLQ